MNDVDILFAIGEWKQMIIDHEEHIAAYKDKIIDAEVEIALLNVNIARLKTLIEAGKKKL